MNLPRNAQLWLPGYLKSRVRAAFAPAPKRVWLMLADHYEPLCFGADEVTAAARVRAWSEAWPRIAGEFRDSAGRPPKHTFFYPEEEYRPALLDSLAAMTADGIADVEVHLHHDGESEPAFLARMGSFMETLASRHGLLHRENGAVAFGFIHGNWALDNSRPDGRWCGLNNELSLLVKLGCYADFTLPSAPSPTQVHIINTIYWAVDNPHQPKSHDRGIPVAKGGSRPEGALLMVPGPLAVRMPGTDGRWIPRLETGEVSGYDLPTAARAALWMDTAPRIGSDIFIKLFTHGAQERNLGPLLERGLRSLYGAFGAEAGARGLRHYFVSGWEMRQAIEALRRGADPVAAAFTPASPVGAL